MDKQERREYQINWRKQHPGYAVNWMRKKRLQQAKDYWRDREQRIKAGAQYRQTTDRWEFIERQPESTKPAG